MKYIFIYLFYEPQPSQLAEQSAPKTCVQQNLGMGMQCSIQQKIKFSFQAVYLLYVNVTRYTRERVRYSGNTNIITILCFSCFFLVESQLRNGMH